MLPLSPERRQALIQAVITQHTEQKNVSETSQSLAEPVPDCPAAAAAPQQGSIPPTTILSSSLQHRLEAYDESLQTSSLAADPHVI